MASVTELKDKLFLLLKWLLLVGLSVAMIFFLEWVACPAANFLAPMLTGIFLACLGLEVGIHKGFFTLAQGLVGTMIASSITPMLWGVILNFWPYLLSGTVWAMLCAAFLGLTLTRLNLLPGTTAVWGLSPGAASIMTIMSANYGADMRLVAFAQYLRVVVVSLVAALVSRLNLGQISANPLRYTPDIIWLDLLLTLVTILIGLGLAIRTRFPGGLILIPMILAATIKNTIDIAINLPQGLLYLSYAIIGWKIGLSFSRSIVIRALKIMPAILASVILLILGCSLFAWFLVSEGLDPLTAYLATSPGGLDAVIIIAAGSGLDLSFILAMQTVRLFLVILTGPPLAQLVTRLCRKSDRTV